MKIVVTGTRGIPDIQGGIETHCEELFPRLTNLGYDITIIRRSCYVNPADRSDEFRGVKLKTIFAPHLKSYEALTHTFLSILYAKRIKADIIHIHAVGPAVLTPLARLLGLKVVFTHHGPDYKRAKWGAYAKFVLRLGERIGTKWSDEVIVISRVIQELLADKYKRMDTHLIYNGVPAAQITGNSAYINNLGLRSRGYIFTAGRFVKEKGFDLLMRAYNNIRHKDIKLVIAGDADHETAYSRELKQNAKEHGVILTGFVKGEKLQELFSHAGLFILPSFHEGLPISLLEAMSYKLPVLVSNIPANMQIGLPGKSYFTSGDEKSLIEKLDLHLNSGFKPADYDMAPYNWDQIALQTKAVYDKVMG